MSTPLPPRGTPSRHLVQRNRALTGSVAALALLANSCLPLHGAIQLGADGFTLTFDSLPDVGDWSTGTFAGAAGDILDPTAMDTRVSTITASMINTALAPSTTAGGSGTNALARYNSTDLDLSTRPTGVAFTPLMTTLLNEAGGSITKLEIEYDFGAYASVAPDPGLEGHRVYFSLDGALWTPIEPLSNIGAAQKLNTTINVPEWREGSLMYLLWIDDNGPGTDGGFTLDNFRLKPTVDPGIIGRDLVYNRSHTVGGAPNGILSTTGNYFLEGATPTAFATHDVVNFSQNGDATIDVPADVTAGGVVASNASGTYTIGGAGKITGPFTKSSTGTAVFTSANAFTKSTISGGTVETRAGALGAGTVTMSGTSVWKVTTAAQDQSGSISVGTGGATIQTDADLTASGLNGDGLLTKTGTATLFFRGGGNGTGGINVTAGKLSLAAPVGGPTTVIKMNGNQIEFTNVADVTFSDSTNPRTLDLGATGGTIAVTAPGVANPATAGVIIGNPDSLVSGGTITKTGAGVLRMRSDHFALTSDWVVQEGTLESGAFTSPLGSGVVTVNAAGRLAGQNTTVPNVIHLNGGDLGTRSGDLTNFTGNITVQANSTVTMQSYTTPANGQDITLSGVLSGTGDLTLRGVAAANPNGPKALILTNSANTFGGTFHVQTDQTLAAQPATGTGSPLNSRPVVLSNGTLRVRDDGTANDGVINYGNNVAVETGASVIDVGPLFGLNTGNTVQFGTLRVGNPTLTVLTSGGYKAAFSGATTLEGNATFNLGGDLILAGAVSGSFGITTVGSGHLTLEGSNSYTGPTNVLSGTLLVNGTLEPTSVVTVSGGTLGGRGTIPGTVTVNSGSLAPGNGPGTLTGENNLLLGAGSTLSLDISHGAGATAAPGIDYDRLVIGTGTAGSSTGAVELQGGSLNLTIGTGILEGDLFFVLANDGTDPITGTFRDLPDGAIFTQGGQGFQISYDANLAAGTFDGGNDIALLAVPEPATASMLALGSVLLLRRRRRG